MERPDSDLLPIKWTGQKGQGEYSIGQLFPKFYRRELAEPFLKSLRSIKTYVFF